MSEYKDGDIRIVQETDYPVGCVIKIKAEGISHLALRIPSWCDKFEINAEYTLKDGYAYVEKPTEIELCIDMKPKLYSANAEVLYCDNKVALMLGPIVYCAEGVDNGVNLHRLYLSRNINAKLSYNDEYKLNTIEVDGYIRNSSERLYEPLSDNFEESRIKLIPYNAFANRGETDMMVWMNYR